MIFLNQGMSIKGVAIQTFTSILAKRILVIRGTFL